MTVVALEVMVPFKVVFNSKAAIETPPTASSTEVNLTRSLTYNPPKGNEKVNVVLEAVENGSLGKKSSVANSVLAGLACCKA